LSAVDAQVENHAHMHMHTHEHTHTHIYFKKVDSDKLLMHFQEGTYIVENLAAVTPCRPSFVVQGPQLPCNLLQSSFPLQEYYMGESESIQKGCWLYCSLCIQELVAWWA